MRFFNSAIIILIGFICPLTVKGQTNAPYQIHVSPTGVDADSKGTAKKPLASLSFALKKAALSKQNDIEIYLNQGDYYLNNTIKISSKDFLNKKLTIIGNGSTLSAGQKLSLKWTKYKGEIWQTTLNTEPFEQLYVNGVQQVLARYPNYDSTAHFFNGTAADALDKVLIWKKPQGVYVHGLHQGEWGSFHYRIKDVKNGKIEWEGGWQNNCPSPLHPTHRFVENAFEALDAPNEWYYDKENKTLYFIPTTKMNLNDASIEVSRLKHSIEIVGDEQNPIKNIEIKGIKFVENERTIMQPYEPLLRSDWQVYRGGAVVLENTENCHIKDCEFTNLGGNAVFFSRYNKNSSVSGSHFHEIGASAICFIGDSTAVRSPSYRYEFFVPFNKLDATKGPKNDKYPRECKAFDNLIHRIGRIEKQATGVEIEMSSQITVSHNTIYDVPRAGINIGSGSWGGHILEFNDVFNTVLETGDHGAFNSWGRDRYWHPDRDVMNKIAAEHPEYILLDAQKTVTIRNNRFRCDHGWDIDLDDGSSNFDIYNNVCLNGGLKLREGFYRKVENNIIINNSFHPHVWFENSYDVFQHNIVQKEYFPIIINNWGKMVDNNLFPDLAALNASLKRGTDKNSIIGNPLFVDAPAGNYTVAPLSPAFKIGFQNFSMDNFGVQNPKLKSMAAHVPIPEIINTERLSDKTTIVTLMGGDLKSIDGLGERSAYGLPDATGVVLLSMSDNSFFKQSGFIAKDVIRMADARPVTDLKSFMDIVQSAKWKPSINVEVFRGQQMKKLVLLLK